MNMSCVRKGNIVYTESFYQTGLAHIPLYLANGWIGGSFDEFGFHSRPCYDMDQGRTHFGYVNHYVTKKNGGHDLFPLLQVSARDAQGRAPGLADLESYRQVLDIHDMTLATRWEHESLYCIRAFTSMHIPQLFEMKITCHTPPHIEGLTVTAQFDTSAADTNARSQHYAHSLGLAASPQLGLSREGEHAVRVRSTTNAVTTDCLVAVTGSSIECDGSCIRFTLQNGTTTLRVLVIDAFLEPGIAVRAVDYVTARTGRYYREHVGAARAFWENSGTLLLPAGPARTIWLRSKYYLAAAVAPFPTHLMVPTGLNANIWGHGFPQDGYYVAENLPRLGLLDRAQAQMAYWLSNLEAVKRYTKRIAQREGAFYPWIPPFQDWDQFEKDGPTNEDSFEFHNSGYVAAMVWNYYCVTRDREFLATYAPVIQEVARFYLSITELPAEGKARMVHPHIRSQDEAMEAGAVTISPLCAVYAALYALRACAAARREGIAIDQSLCERGERVLERGYDFESLLGEDGMLKTSASDTRPRGFQKHPVQLNCIALLPLPDYMDWEPVRLSWEQRYQLTRDATVPVSFGWTLGLFALASARMRSPRELRRDLRMIQPARFADPHFIQFYESSCRNGWSHKKSYYFTVSGLYLQALTDAVVQYCRGTIDLFAALLPEWETQRIEMQKLRTTNALSVEGVWDRGSFRVCLQPAVDVCMPVRVSRPIRGIRLCTGNNDVLKTFDGNVDTPWDFKAGVAVVLLYGNPAG